MLTCTITEGCVKNQTRFTLSSSSMLKEPESWPDRFYWFHETGQTERFQHLLDGWHQQFTWAGVCVCTSGVWTVFVSGQQRVWPGNTNQRPLKVRWVHLEFQNTGDPIKSQVLERENRSWVNIHQLLCTRVCGVLNIYLGRFNLQTLLLKMNEKCAEIVIFAGIPYFWALMTLLLIFYSGIC